MWSCVVLLALCACFADVSSTCVDADNVLRCHCDSGNVFHNAEVTNKISPQTKEFILSNCNSVEVTQNMFIHAKNTTSIHLDSINTLKINTVLPSNLQKLHISNAYLESISDETFSDISHLKQLVIENTLISNIKNTTLFELNFGSIAFKNVTFQRLVGNSLNMNFVSEEQKTKLVITDCRFQEIDNKKSEAVITANADNIVFSNNALKCDEDNLMMTYAWLAKLFEKKMRKNKTIICSYLTHNYCGDDKTPENRILHRLLKEKVTTSTGIMLNKCKRMESTPTASSRNVPPMPANDARSSTASAVLTAVLVGSLVVCGV